LAQLYKATQFTRVRNTNMENLLGRASICTISRIMDSYTSPL